MLFGTHCEAHIANCHPDRAAFPHALHQPGGESAVVLLIDNEATLRQLFTVVLTQQGYRCYEASNGLAGLAQLATNKPDLILLDINMPGLDGFEVLTRLRQQDPVVGIIMCSARSAKHFAAKAISAGADGYLTKPVRIPLLLEEIDRIYQIVRLRRNQSPIANRYPRPTAPN